MSDNKNFVVRDLIHGTVNIIGGLLIVTSYRGEVRIHISNTDGLCGARISPTIARDLAAKLYQTADLIEGKS